MHGISVAVERKPKFDELVDIIANGFSKLGLSTTQLIVGVSAMGSPNLSDRFISVYDRGDYYCIVTFYNWDIDLRSEDEIGLPIMMSIKSRGHEKFACIVAYILSEALGGRRFEDEESMLSDIVYNQNDDKNKKLFYSINELKYFSLRFLQEIY